MKGTIFSADFIKDADANLRLLELNTDTGFITNTLDGIDSRFDFTAFISVLNSNSISELVIIYKSFHLEFVELLKVVIARDATFITTVTEQKELINTIYPTAPTDSDSKFILRCAYDENALFDSTYCKDRANVQKLFYDNSATGSIPEFYCSGSEYEVSTLRGSVNDHDTLPDFVIKPKSETHKALKFFNIGAPESSSAERVDLLLAHDDIDTEMFTVEKYHYNESDVASNGKVDSYRVVGIVYGSDIDYITIGQWNIKAFLDIPTISETSYITNNKGLVTVLEDFETAADNNLIQVADGMPTPVIENLGGRNCLKVMTSDSGDEKQSVQLQLRHGDLDLRTSNKIVTVDIFSETATSILARANHPITGTTGTATGQSHGGSGWETLQFNFANAIDGTDAANDIYQRIAFFPLWNGTDWDSPSTTTTYYDNIKGLKCDQGGGPVVQPFNDKHYFQLTSNWFRLTNEGAMKGTNVLNIDNTSKAIETIVTGSLVKSIFINGVPDTDLAEMYNTWTSTGASLPDGSHITASMVEGISELAYNREYGVLGEVKVSAEDFIYTNINKHFLVYSTGSNEMSFKQQYKIDSADDFLVDQSGSLVPITSNKVVIIEDDEKDSLYQLDVETSDAYFISSSVAPIIVHNAPCFVAGTKISCDGEEKNIEDVKVGDSVWTFNHESSKKELKLVNELLVKENEEVIEYTIEDENEILLKGTPDHPIFIEELGDYASFNPKDTLTDSKLEVGQIKEGMTVKFINDSGDFDNYKIKSIKKAGMATVYNLLNVEDNHNFYANGILVHNRGGCFIAGTEIKLANGDSKNIEDIIVGDEVIGWKDGEFANSIVSELKPTILGNRYLYNINGLKTTFTSGHPFLTKDGWKSIVPGEGTDYGTLKVGDIINKDGNWIQIKEINEIKGEFKQPVYNFSVTDIHSYIADGIVVHNK